MPTQKSLASRSAARVRSALRVLRGTHFATPRGHLPPSIRNNQIISGDRVWWQYLHESRTAHMFPELTDQSRDAVSHIQNVYASSVERFGITKENFFGGSIKNDEAIMLHQLVLDTKPNNVVQIGTFIGYSAAIIADALRRNGNGHLVCIDPEIPHRSNSNPVDIAREFFSDLKLEQFATFEKGWSSGRLPFLQDLEIPTIGSTCLETIGGGIDFAFIDGDHSTAFTLMDFHTVREYLNKGGTVLFHDAHTWPTVAQAISIIWSDIFFGKERKTEEFFDLDVRMGLDGLAILRAK